MSRLRVWWSQVSGFVRRRPSDDRLDREIRTHLDRLADEQIAHGMPPEDARLAARRRLAASIR